MGEVVDVDDFSLAEVGGLTSWNVYWVGACLADDPLDEDDDDDDVGYGYMIIVVIVVLWIC